MRHGKSSFRHESLQDADSIQQLLDAISKGLARGKLKFSDDDDEMLMTPKGLLQLKVTASQEESRNRINIRVTWQDEQTVPKKKKSLKVLAK